MVGFILPLPKPDVALYRKIGKDDRIWTHFVKF
jgi:hypothetical protein